MKRTLALVVAILMLLPFSSFFVSAEEQTTIGGFLSEKFKSENSYTYGDDDTVHAIVITDGNPSSDYGETGTASETQRTTKLKKQHSKIWATMQSKNLEYQLVAEYTSLINGFGVVTTYGDLKKIAEISGVNNVYISNRYNVPQAEYTVQTVGSAYAQGTTAVNSCGYYGQGMTVAVIDTGLNVNHVAFADYGLTQGGFDKTYIKELISEGIICDGKYVSAKIPFVYDYADCDNDVKDLVGHGTHVSGIAAGFDGESVDNYYFTGAAPAAQIISMKVFSDYDSYSYDEIIFAALEDAFRLNVDVVNMSLGSTSGFTYDSILEDYYSNIFEKMHDAGIVVCCAAGNETSQALEKGYVYLDYTDYGVIGAPATYTGNISVAAANNYLTIDPNRFKSGDELSYYDEERAGLMAGYSSMGVTSDLQFGPMITGVGSNVYSANNEIDDGYIICSGTSMACPNVAGNMLLVLQYLKEKHPELKKPERADVAQKLLENTATILLNETGSEYSPRIQGAGLIDTYRAINSYTYISNPIESLGDNPEFDKVTVSVEILNNDSVAHQYSVNPVVTVDSLEKSKYGLINTTSQDTIPSDAIQFDGELNFELKAGEKKTLDYTFVVPEDIYDLICAAGIAGMFADGYLVFEDENGNQCHKSFISFFGDWTKGRIIEGADYSDLMYIVNQLFDLGATEEQAYDLAKKYLTLEVGCNQYYLCNMEFGYGIALGENYFSDNSTYDYSEKRFSFSPAVDGESHSDFDTLLVFCSLLRNAKQVIITVSDSETGKIYYAETQNYIRKNLYDYYDKSWNPHTYFMWDGTDFNGDVLPNDKSVTIDFYAYLDYQDIELLDSDEPSDVAKFIEDNKLESQWSFDVYIDNILPKYEIKYSNDNIVIDFYENHYLALAAFGEYVSAKPIVFETYFDDEKVEKHTITIPADEIEEGVYIVQGVDYAGNIIVDYIYIDSDYNFYHFDENGFCENGNGYWLSDGVLSYYEIDNETEFVDVYFNGETTLDSIDYPMGPVAKLASDLGYGINMWLTETCQDCVTFPSEAVAILYENMDGNFIWEPELNKEDGFVSIYFDPCGVDLSDSSVCIWFGGYNGLGQAHVYTYNLFGIIDSVYTDYDSFNNVLYFWAYGPTYFEIYEKTNLNAVVEKFANKAEFYAGLSEACAELTLAFTDANIQILAASSSSAIYAQEAASAAIEAQQLAELAQANAEEAASSAIAAQKEAERILGDINATKDEIDAANSSAIAAKSAAETAKTAAESAKAAAKTAQAAAEVARDRAEAAALRAEQACSSAILANSSAIEAKEAAQKAQAEAEKALAEATAKLSSAIEAQTAAETAQAAAEAAKAEAEAAKKAADADKDDTVAAKKAAETAKAAAEAEKKAIETAKAAAEAERTAAEAAKVAAEAAKAAAEAEKKAAESAKAAAEAEKKASETAKAEAEAAKKAAEDARDIADNNRKEAEAAKADAEAAKKQAEDAAEEVKKLLEEAKAQAQSGCKSSVSALIVVAVLGVTYTFVRKKNDD